MKQSLLPYSPDFDVAIARVVEHELNAKVTSVNRIQAGEVSFAYKVQAQTGEVVIAKIFRLKEFVPPEGKLEWIEQQLQTHHILFAKTYKIDRSSNIFPYGYMVQEFIEGQNGFEAIMAGHLSFEAFFDKLALLLYQIHQISIAGYGAICDGEGKFKTFYESELHFVGDIHVRLRSLPDIDEATHKRVFAAVEDLKAYEHLFKPVLVHGDPPPSNGIIAKGGELVLIDWDNASSGIWISEFAGLTFRGAYMWQHGLSEEERNRIIARSFRNFYPGVDFDDPDLLEVVRLLHILNAYHALAVHYFQHQDMELYEMVKRQLRLRLG